MHRARVVVALTVATVFALVLTGVSVSPAPAQMIELPSESDPSSSSTSAPDVTPTTAKRSTKGGVKGTTTLDNTTTTMGDSSTTTASPAVGASPSTSASARASTPRRSPSSTSLGAERTGRGRSSGSGSPTTQGSPAMLTTTSVRPLGATTTSSPLPVQKAVNTSGLSIGNVVAVIIAGLLAVAAVLSLVTVRYWRATRPGDDLSAG